MFTQLDFYKILFMAELLVAEFLFTFRSKKRRYFAARISLMAVVCIALAFLCPVLLYNEWYVSIMFFVLFALTMPFLKLCYDESWLNIVFCAFAAYILQHFGYALSSFIITAGGISDISSSTTEGATIPWEIYGSGAFQLTNGFSYIVYFGSYFFTYWVGFLLFARKIKKGEELHLSGVQFLIIASFILVIDIVLNAMVVYYSYRAYDRTYYLISLFYNMVLGAVALVLQFNMLKVTELNEELSIERYFSREKEKQYALSKETIELINQKSHDLRHQIRKWGNLQGISKEAVREAEEIINVYDSILKTGNEALDIILTEKSLLCMRYGIRFSCMADGKILGFMRETDLYALFGNMIENAIEAARNQDEEKRVIYVSVRPINEMVMIKVKNFYQGMLEFVDGIPQTKKKEREYHGFGVRSMRRIVEKYDGNLKIKAEDGVFTVSIVLPCVTRQA